MSHMVDIELEITDLGALEAACRRLGLVLRADRKTATYYANSRVNCDAVIQISGCGSEIAVTKKRGKYVLSYDPANGMETNLIEKAAGRSLDRLTQAYTLEKAKKELRAKGFSYIQEKCAQNGAVKLTAKKKAKQAVRAW